jgi:hypothetical protein
MKWNNIADALIIRDGRWADWWCCILCPLYAFVDLVPTNIVQVRWRFRVATAPANIGAIRDVSDNCKIVVQLSIPLCHPPSAVGRVAGQIAQH